MSAGKVYLVGAGPGDPKLITVGGAEALREADVVVYDRLAHPSLLSLAAGAEKIYVGKQADRHALPQDEINALLVDRAQAGRIVVRLKGGDPFVFGRGGEEAEYLQERGVPWSVIPGVTSAIAAPAYAGIPVTHRDCSSSFAVITGHERDDARESGGRAAGAAEGRRRWDRIAHAADTLLFLMGVENLEEIVHELTRHGRDPETPVALVRWGTWAGHQQTLTGTLADIVERVRATGFKAPAVTVVGEVVRLRERIRWFDSGPLSGRRILVTRARDQASDFADLLRAKYAEPIEFPLIKIVAPPDGYAALDAVLGRLSEFAWMLLASAPAVNAVFERLRAQGRDARALYGLRVAVVGPATARTLRGYGIEPDFIPEATTGAGLAENLPGDLSGVPVLLPRALVGDDATVDALQARGARLEAVPAYENVPDIGDTQEIAARLQSGGIDIVTFTSSSTVKNFVSALGPDALPSTVGIACIGPSTAKTAASLLGRETDLMAEEHTVSGLVAALEGYFAARPIEQESRLG